MLKNLLLAFGLCLFYGTGFGQSAAISHILNKPPNFIDTIEPDRPNTVYLNCHYASPTILNPGDIELVKNQAIIKVELVYTTHREVLTFNQLQLNKNRLINLEKLYPDLFKNTAVKWKITGQTDCKSRQTGQGFFHGFLITYRPPYIEADTKKELDFIEKMLNSEKASDKTGSDNETVNETSNDKAPEPKPSAEKPLSKEEIEKRLGLDNPPSFVGGEPARIKYINDNLTYPAEAQRHAVEGMVITSFLVGPTGSIEEASIIKGLDESCNIEALRVVRNMPPWNPGYRNGKPVPIHYTMPIMFVLEDKNSTKTLLYAGEPSIDTTGMHLDAIEVREPIEKKKRAFTKKMEEDSVIHYIFKRNPEWKDILVVCDVTGSMSPYTTQVLSWFRFTMKDGDSRVKHFTFFNDGNNAKDKNKRIGRTGGIYHQPSNIFDEVKNRAFEAMRNGGGGDLPENNLEATIAAIKECSNCGDIVWIADNYAAPRDISLISKIDKPIHIILCGTYYGVNMEYLTLALQNGGSIHTIEKDVINLNELKDGEKIELGYQKFQRRENWFVPIYDY